MPAMTEAHRRICEANGRTRMTASERAEARNELNRARPRGYRTAEARRRRLKQGKPVHDSFLKWCERYPDSLNPKEEYQEEQRVKAKEQSRKYHQAHRLESRANGLRRNYGLSVAEYEALVTAQHGCCAICGQLNQILSVDHSHLTGRVRGLLCPLCNLCIGQMGESPERLRRAAEYLEHA